MGSPTSAEEPGPPRAADSSAVDRHVPVLVVGAGPAGLTLANLLGVYGTAALLVERNAATVNEPRAVSIDDESLRTMQAIGLSELVLRTVLPGYGSDYLTPDGRCFLTVEPTGRPFGFPRRNAFRQPQLEAQLQEGTRRFSCIESWYGCTLESFTQDETGVTARVAGRDGALRSVRCDYLIGCDGAASGVRRQLGLRLEGKTFAERWLIVDLADSPADRRNTVVFCNTLRPCIALPGPERTRRFEFKLHPGESDADMLQPAMIERLLREHGAHADSVLVRKVVYTFHARVVPRWSAGRVFLAGDAAHLTPPFAGQGMNSGLRDCSNLAWKLAMVTTNRMPATLLATYEQERLDHVWQMIQLALRMGRIMSPKSKLHGFLVQSAFLAIGAWPRARSFFAEMKYKPKPKFTAGFMQADGFDKRSTLVGRMLAQPQVRVQGGQGEALLDEVLGAGFALVGVEVPLADMELARAAPAIARLAPNCVVLNPRPAGEGAGAGAGASTGAGGGHAVTLAALDSWPPELQRYRGRLLLVRPDRYVAASGTSGGTGSIAAAVNTLFHRLNA